MSTPLERPRRLHCARSQGRCRRALIACTPPLPLLGPVVVVVQLVNACGGGVGGAVCVTPALPRRASTLARASPPHRASSSRGTRPRSLQCAARPAHQLPRPRGGVGPRRMWGTRLAKDCCGQSMHSLLSDHNTSKGGS